MSLKFYQPWNPIEFFTNIFLNINDPARDMNCLTLRIRDFIQNVLNFYTSVLYFGII